MTPDKGGRPKGGAEEFDGLRRVLLHLVCRWEVFYQGKTGPRIGELLRMVRILYGVSYPHVTIGRQADHLVTEGMLSVHEEGDEFTKGKVYRSTERGHDEWMQMLASGIPVLGVTETG